MVKKCIGILFIIFAVLFQISFLNNLYFPFNQINIVLVFLIFISFINYDYGLYWLAISVLILEIYSQYPFGMIILAYTGAFMLIIWLYNNFFTNKSLYSLIVLGSAGVFFYNVFIYFSVRILFLFNLSKNYIELNNQYFFYLIWNLFLSLICLIILFILFRALSKKMKIFFLIK